MNQDNYSEDFMNQAYQQAGQMGEQNDPNSLYADYMREERVRNLIEQINPDLLLEDIEHRIRGEIKDRYTKEWIKLGTGIGISENLIAKYISFLGAILNQNTALSNFSAPEINNLMNVICEYVGNDLADNSREYGFTKVNKILVQKEIKQLYPITKIVNNYPMITYGYISKVVNEEIELDLHTDYNEMTRIANILCMAVFAVFKRAQNGMEARRIFGALKVTENLSTQPQKKSLGDMLAFWK